MGHGREGKISIDHIQLYMIQRQFNKLDINIQSTAHQLVVICQFFLLLRGLLPSLVIPPFVLICLNLHFQTSKLIHFRCHFACPTCSLFHVQTHILFNFSYRSFSIPAVRGSEKKKSDTGRVRGQSERKRNGKQEC